jgi:PleD family two-component response regulator
MHFRFQARNDSTVNFTNSLPTAEAPILRAAAECEKRRRTSHSSFRLVEPSLTQRHITQQRFDKLGIQYTDFATTGHNGIAEIRQNRPDVVVSSLYLPEMNGQELLEFTNPVCRCLWCPQ